jgi:hypothetical protein
LSQFLGRQYQLQRCHFSPALYQKHSYQSPSETTNKLQNSHVIITAVKRPSEVACWEHL